MIHIDNMIPKFFGFIFGNKKIEIYIWSDYNECWNWLPTSQVVLYLNQNKTSMRARIAWRMKMWFKTLTQTASTWEAYLYKLV